MKKALLIFVFTFSFFTLGVAEATAQCNWQIWQPRETQEQCFYHEDTDANNSCVQHTSRISGRIGNITHEGELYEGRVRLRAEQQGGNEIISVLDAVEVTSEPGVRTFEISLNSLSNQESFTLIPQVPVGNSGRSTIYGDVENCAFNFTTFRECEVNSCNTEPAQYQSNTDPDDPVDGLEVFEGPTNATFDSLNPLLIFGDENSAQLTTPGGILTRVLLFAFPIGGMILFVMILWGGFEILAGSAGKQSLDAGKQRITAAVVGFILLFTSYWIIQILEIVFGIAIV